MFNRLRGGAYRVPTPAPSLGVEAAERLRIDKTAPGELYDPERKPGFYILRLSPQMDRQPMVIDYWNGTSWYNNGVRDLRIMRVVKLLEEV